MAGALNPGATPLLALLRRLEAQNIWRMSHSVLSAQHYSSAAAAEPAAGVWVWVWPAAAPHRAPVGGGCGRSNTQTHPSRLHWPCLALLGPSPHSMWTAAAHNGVTSLASQEICLGSPLRVPHQLLCPFRGRRLPCRRVWRVV